MRFLFRSFVALDLISLVFIGMQLWYATFYFDQIIQPSERINAVLRFPMFLLVLIGAVGLWGIKKYGCILYYIQFPFRLYLRVFSLGFITLLPEAFELYDNEWLFDSLLKTCFVGEFIRLFFTVKTQLKMRGLK